MPGLGNRIFKDYIKKISSTQEDHKGEYYVRDASGNILAVYNTHSSYSPLQIVTAVTGVVKGDPGFPAFVVDKIAIKGSFKPKLISKALETNPEWAQQQTDKPISFYLDRDDELYSRLLFSSSGYLNDLQQYDLDNSTNIYPDAFINQPDHAETFMYDVLQISATGEEPQGTEALALLKHFDEIIPPDFTTPMWNSFGQPHSADDHEVNATNLYTYMKERRAYGAVAQLMRQGMQVYQETNTREFVSSVVNDETIFHSERLRFEGSEIDYLLSSILYNGASRDALNVFFDQWLQSSDWLASNTALDRRLEMVYDDNPAATITDFTNVSVDNYALEEIIADMPEVPAMEYALKVIADFNDAATAATLALGANADTITLAEHHIYGSARLGIQTYDTTYRNTFNANPNITSITRLSTNRSYYSSAYGDYVRYSYKEPWCGVDTGVIKEQRTLGRRYYEMTDHLGNVLATVMDRKTGAGHSGVGTLYDHWHADLASVQDYYPGGMMMPGRWKAMNGDTTLYRYGVQSGHKDNEIYGFGGWTDLGARGLMNNIMRLPSRDPLYFKFPGESPYSYAGNNPILNVDKKGEKKTVYTTILRDNKPPEVVKVEVLNKYKYVNTFDGFVMTNYHINQTIDLRKDTKPEDRFSQSNEIPDETVSVREMAVEAYNSATDGITPPFQVMVFGSGNDYADWLKNPRAKKGVRVISIDFRKLDGLMGDILTGMISMPEYNAPTGPESFETAMEKTVDLVNDKVKEKMEGDQSKQKKACKDCGFEHEY